MDRPAPDMPVTMRMSCCWVVDPAVSVIWEEAPSSRSGLVARVVSVTAVGRGCRVVGSVKATVRTGHGARPSRVSSVRASAADGLEARHTSRGQLRPSSVTSGTVTDAAGTRPPSASASTSSAASVTLSASSASSGSSAPSRRARRRFRGRCRDRGAAGCGRARRVLRELRDHRGRRRRPDARDDADLRGGRCRSRATDPKCFRSDATRDGPSPGISESCERTSRFGGSADG